MTIIKTARNYAATSFQTNGEIPEEGYGVYIDKDNNKLILFANTSAADTGTLNQYDVNGVNPDDTALEPKIKNSYELEYNFPPETILADIIADDKYTGTHPDRAVIIFRPPTAEAYIGENQEPDLVSTDQSEITTLFLKFYRRDKEADDGSNKCIKINTTAGFPEIRAFATCET